MHDDPQPIEKRTPHPPRGVARRKKTSQRYPLEFKRRAVQLFLKEGFTRNAIAVELDIAVATLDRWVARFRHHGEQGLLDEATGPHPGQPKVPPAVTEHILALKKDNPSFGVKRISQWLRRLFFLSASAETVRARLHQAGLLTSASLPKKRNLTRPRFFERATPNQLWQSDIFTFRLGGRYAYLIAFLDDYSRYVTGADLFRSPTAQATIEVYRVAVGEYQPPKEMLTDNGRQYTTWRGTSRFEAELRKDRVAHIKSRPHHPMTLGKIERFWESIWQEFLTRAQFDSFEQARERIKLWIKYYNHRRPHQGIEGLCPADRFFEIQNELRKTIATGIQENILEMALRGAPRAPFYMVGRMEGQSVVLRAEKGKLKLEVSDPSTPQTSGAIKQLTYELDKNNSDSTQRQNQNPKEQTPLHLSELHGDGQSPGRAGGVDRALQTSGCLPANEHQLDDLQPLAEPSDGGNAASVGGPSEPGAGTSLEPAPAEPSSKATTLGQSLQTLAALGSLAKQHWHQNPGDATKGVDEPSREGPSTSGNDLESPLRPDHCHPSSPSPGHLPPTL